MSISRMTTKTLLASFIPVLVFIYGLFCNYLHIHSCILFPVVLSSFRKGYFLVVHFYFVCIGVFPVHMSVRVLDSLELVLQTVVAAV